MAVTGLVIMGLTFIIIHPTGITIHSGIPTHTGILGTGILITMDMDIGITGIIHTGMILTGIITPDITVVIMMVTVIPILRIKQNAPFGKDQEKLYAEQVVHRLEKVQIVAYLLVQNVLHFQ